MITTGGYPLRRRGTSRGSIVGFVSGYALADLLNRQHRATLTHQHDEVAQGASEPVQAPDHQGVLAVAQLLKRAVQLRAIP